MIEFKPMEAITIYSNSGLNHENFSGFADPATLSEELPLDVKQMDITDPGWRSELQPPDIDAPHGYKEPPLEVIVEF